MSRAVTIANLVAVTKQTLIQPTDFIELWVINELLDDLGHRKMLGDRLTGERYSVVRIDQPQFDQLNEPHGLYGDRHIRLHFGETEIFINTDAIYRLAAPTQHIEALNARLEGNKWVASPTEGYAVLNVSDVSQSKYFQRG